MALINLLLTPWTLALIPLLYYLLPWLRNNGLRSIPGPPVAAFSNLWLFWQSRLARRSYAVDAAHKRYGDFVRIQPDHVSVARDDAIPIVYGHGNGNLKAQFYDAFLGHGSVRNVFNVRSRPDHTRKRKIISHIFAQREIVTFEPYVHANLERFLEQWDKICDNAHTVVQGDSKDSRPYAEMDALNWFNYLAFDIIGDLAFGGPFGMLERGADIAEIRDTHDAAPRHVPAVEVLNKRGEVSATLGCMPWLRPWAPWSPDPFFSSGAQAIKDLAGIAIARVRNRYDEVETGHVTRKDLLQRLMEAKDEHGELLGRDEVTSEALAQLIAGSDTTSNTLCALLYHVTRTPGVQQKLQQELDQEMPPGLEIPTFETARGYTYVEQVVNETLRIHGTSSIGLPRVLREDGQGATIAGRYFPPGTVLSVPSFCIHHSRDIWGADADEFVPDRWAPERLTERQRNAFIPFSFGPRACVGRNLAEAELATVCATVFKRYEFVLRQGEMETREGFLKKPVKLDVAIRRRHEGKTG